MDSTAEFMDMILSGGSPEDVSDKIKEILYSKSSNIIDELKPAVAQSMFSQEEE
jgi:hypothetical protein